MLTPNDRRAINDLETILRHAALQLRGPADSLSDGDLPTPDRAQRIRAERDRILAGGHP